MRDFLLIEDKISLKVIFDNIRNYAIVGGLIVYASWSIGKLPKTISNGPMLNDTFVRFLIAASLSIFVLTLLLLNVAQSALILQRLIEPKLKSNKKSTPNQDDTPSPIEMLLLIVFAPIFFFAFVSLFFVIPWSIFNIIEFTTSRMK